MNEVLLPKSLLAYYARVNAEVLNFRRAMIKIHKGEYYLERALIRIDGDGEIKVTTNGGEAEKFIPTEEEAKQIKTDWAAMEMPKAITTTEVNAADRAAELGGDVRIFRNKHGVVMLQQRVPLPDGGKKFVPWTFFSDGEWRPLEPDGALPLWKPKSDSEKVDQIMIHEGGKAAEFAQRLVDEKIPHPWLEELCQFEHWGMIGGALAPHRTDYKEIHEAKPNLVVYLCDNDYPGKKALQLVSQNYGRRLRGIALNPKVWHDTWDIADPMPKELFTRGRYTGPTLAEMMKPATWFTN